MPQQDSTSDCSLPQSSMQRQWWKNWHTSPVELSPPSCPPPQLFPQQVWSAPHSSLRTQPVIPRQTLDSNSPPSHQSPTTKEPAQAPQTNPSRANAPMDDDHRSHVDIHYVGIFLAGPSKMRLLEAFPPVHAIVHAHHATLAFEPSLDRVVQAYGHLLGCDVSMPVQGAAIDARTQALDVSIPSWVPYLNTAPPHVTVSVVPEAEAKDAGQLIRNEKDRARALPGIKGLAVLHGTVGVCLTDRRVVTSLDQLHEVVLGGVGKHNQHDGREAASHRDGDGDRLEGDDAGPLGPSSRTRRDDVDDASRNRADVASTHVETAAPGGFRPGHVKRDCRPGGAECESDDLRKLLDELHHSDCPVSSSRSVRSHNFHVQGSAHEDRDAAFLSCRGRGHATEGGRPQQPSHASTLEKDIDLASLVSSCLPPIRCASIEDSAAAVPMLLKSNEHANTAPPTGIDITSMPASLRLEQQNRTPRPCAEDASAERDGETVSFAPNMMEWYRTIHPNVLAMAVQLYRKQHPRLLAEFLAALQEVSGYPSSRLDVHGRYDAHSNAWRSSACCASTAPSRHLLATLRIREINCGSNGKGGKDLADAAMDSVRAQDGRCCSSERRECVEVAEHLLRRGAEAVYAENTLTSVSVCAETERQVMQAHQMARSAAFAAQTAAKSREDDVAAALHHSAGKKYAAAVVAARRRASTLAFQARNADILNVFKIDLHGLHVKEAIKTLQRHLDALGGLGHPGGVLLRVVTGFGQHSEGGKAKVLPAVLQELSQRGLLFDVEANNPGLVRVLI